MSILGKSLRWHKPHNAPRPRRILLRLEELESRIVPYSVSGGAWPHPDLVTLSFVPDGTLLTTNGSGNVYSNLFATFNAKFGSTAKWENVILKSAQVWAQATNLNFAVVTDNGTASGGGNYQQGDPGMGDIRIGGYNFGSSTLASAFMPPPLNNYSIAGDFNFNTGQTFNIGSTYDLFTVSAHEIGHALGLYHSSTVSAIMYGAYSSAKMALNSDDIAGIRNIYSSNNPRTYDAYYTAGPNNSFATAANLNSLIDPNALTALVTGLDVTTTTETEYFTFTAPTNTTGTLVVDVQSQGLSLLAPKFTVYAADEQTVLGSATGINQYGTTITATINGISAGQVFYVKVSGTDSTAFSTGAYAMTLNFGSNPSPTVPLPNTQTLNGNPIVGGGGQPLVTDDGQPQSFDTFEPNGDEPVIAHKQSANGAMAALAAQATPAPAANLPPAAAVQAAVLLASASAPLSAAPAVAPALLPGAAAPLVVDAGPGHNAAALSTSLFGGPSLPSGDSSGELLPSPASVPAREAEGTPTVPSTGATDSQPATPATQEEMLEARDAVFAEPATMNRLASLKEEALVDNEETSFPTERAALLLTGLAFVWGGSGQAFADAPRGRNGKRTWAGSA